jgi:hypothetical protein
MMLVIKQHDRHIHNNKNDNKQIRIDTIELCELIKTHKISHDPVS